MGRFVYDSTLTVTLDDDLLSHLQAVVAAKFRLRQSFYLSWGYPANTGESRTMIWLTPSISVQFHYRAPRAPAVDRDRVAALLADANSLTGLVLIIGA